MVSPVHADHDPLHAEIHALVTASLRGELTPSQWARLEHLVTSNATACQVYVAYIQDTATIERWATRLRPVSPPMARPVVPRSEPAPQVPFEVQPTSRRRRQATSQLTWFVACAAILAIALGSWLIVTLRNPPGVPDEIVTSSVRLSAMDQCVWASDAPQIQENVVGQRLTLDGGLAELVWESGHRAILQGPCSVEPRDGEVLIVHSGTLTLAMADGADGFRVVTPGLTFVDRGTEFGIRAQDGQVTELHVFEGIIEATRNKTNDNNTLSPWTIQAGAAAQWTGPSASYQPLELDRTGFVRSMPQPGLLGEYFNDEHLTEFVMERVDSQIDFGGEDWNLAPHGTTVLPDGNYSERWTGYVRIPAEGDWTFITTSNDGVRLWIDDRLVIDQWTTHVEAEHRRTLRLKPGWRPIRLEHFQRDLDAVICLEYSSRHVPRQVIPTRQLSVTHPATGERHPMAEAR
jgi:hypothetical protein